MIISLGIVSVEIVDDGAGGLYMSTINGYCIKSYYGINRYHNLRRDIKSLKEGEGIDL